MHLTILPANLAWAGSPLTLHACLHQDTVRAQRSSGCRGSFLWPLPVPKSKPDPSGLCAWVLARWWDLFWGTVPNLYGSELWMMNAIDHLVYEWHLNILKVIWSHISFHLNISRSWNSLMDSPPPSVIVEVHHTEFTKRHYGFWPKPKFPVSDIL